MIHGTLMVSISFIPAFIQDQRKQQGVNEAASKRTIEKLKTILGFHEFKPCPFDLGLRKFALDPVVVIFFKNAKKNYK